MILCLSGSLNKPRNAFISQAENMGMQGCKRKGLRRMRTLHFCCVVLAVDAFGGARFSQGRAVFGAAASRACGVGVHVAGAHVDGRKREPRTIRLHGCTSILQISYKSPLFLPLRDVRKLRVGFPRERSRWTRGSALGTRTAQSSRPSGEGRG